ncbi:MAG: hypothetical protein RR984_02675 [Bacilli bacterium]
MGKFKDTFNEYVFDSNRLKNKIKEEREKEIMKNYKKPILIACSALLLLGVILIPIIIKKEYKSEIKYTSYLSENKALTKQEKEYDSKLKDLFHKYEKGEVTMEDYLKEIELIRVVKNDFKVKKVALKDKYGITSNLKLDKVKFSKDKKQDEALKAIYLSSKQLEDKDAQLDAEEDSLERMFIEGSISKEDFISRKAALEAQEDALEAEEDALDAKEEALEKEQEAKEEAEDKAKEEADAAKDKADKLKDEENKEHENNEVQEEVEKPEVEEQEENTNNQI